MNTLSNQKDFTKQGANVSRTKDVPYFRSKINFSLTPAGRQLFETYSRIPASEVEAHIYKFVNGLQSAHKFLHSLLTNLSVI